MAKGSANFKLDHIELRVLSNQFHRSTMESRLDKLVAGSTMGIRGVMTAAAFTVLAALVILPPATPVPGFRVDGRDR